MQKLVVQLLWIAEQAKDDLLTTSCKDDAVF